MGPCLWLIPPTALHGFIYNADAQGRILTLSGTLVDGLFPRLSPVAITLGILQCMTTFQEPYSDKRLAELIEAIDKELFDDRPEKRLMLHVSLQQLFLVIYRLGQQHEETESRENSLSLQYFRRFQHRVRQVGITHTITQLADDLLITHVHLNRMPVSGWEVGQLVGAGAYSGRSPQIPDLYYVLGIGNYLPASLRLLKLLRQVFLEAHGRVAYRISGREG